MKNKFYTGFIICSIPTRSSISVYLGIILLCSINLAQGASLYEQRKVYEQAKSNAINKNYSFLLQNRKMLKDYPLLPYLELDMYMNAFDTIDKQDALKFLLSNKSLYGIKNLQVKLIQYFVQKGDWHRFEQLYDKELKDNNIDCIYAHYRYNQDKIINASIVIELYTKYQSHNDSCTKLFLLFEADNKLTDELKWQRFLFAVHNNNKSLATSIIPKLSKDNIDAANYLLAVLDNATTNSDKILSVIKHRHISDIFTQTLLKLFAQKNLEKSISLYNSYANLIKLNDDNRIKIAKTIGINLARNYDMRADKFLQLDKKHIDNDVSAWHVRYMIKNAKLNKVAQFIETTEDNFKQQPRWRYWRARSLESQGKKKLAQDIYADLARERDFYGLLAADISGKKYNLNNIDINASARTMTSVYNNPAIKRAFEFYNLGLTTEFRREWYNAIKFLTNKELEAAAKISHNMNLHFLAIKALAVAKSWDDLNVRFPLVYKNEILLSSQKYNINQSLIFAIARQESAWLADVRSNAGAMGLMQLMPATAKEVAKRFNIPYKNNDDALKPTINIQLGTAYLSLLSKQFNNNRALVAAAYNAGPNRVKRWLSQAKEDKMHIDSFIETIPFDETRNYVTNVLTYIVIYATKFHTQQRVLEQHETKLL